tara:strand:- start:1608 stop:2039 length:432 start_codon:yes stop_codon:yes gene_type:complete
LNNYGWGKNTPLRWSNFGKWGLQITMRSLLIVLLISLPSLVFGKDIVGTGWVLYEDDGHKTIVLFEKDGTLTFQNMISPSGNEGDVYSREIDTWTINGDVVVLSFTNGFQLFSLTINNRGDSMTGTSINQKGEVRKVKGRLIE